MAQGAPAAARFAVLLRARNLLCQAHLSVPAAAVLVQALRAHSDGGSPDCGASEQNNAAEERVDAAIHAGDGEHARGHAHESEDEEGAPARPTLRGSGRVELWFRPSSLTGCAPQVELRTTQETTDAGALQKCADFVLAFTLGFEVPDALALLRLDDLYIECFEVKDVKQTLHGEHMSRGIGRMAGKGGKTKFTIENVTKTRVVIADTHIRILGSFQNIKLARDAICALIMGSPPQKVVTRLRSVASRLQST